MVKKKKRKTSRKPILYNIILVNHGQHLTTLDYTDTEKNAYKKLNKLLEENKSVKFPVRYNNHEHVMLPSDYELVIIKRKELGDHKVVNLKNDIGDFVGYQTSHDDWVVVDRAPYKIEETFWVYGYHPRLQRKNYDWIIDNFVKINIDNKLSFKTIQVYNNKVLFDIDGNLEIVLCKNKDDAIKLYNMIEEYSKGNKLKRILFMGDLRRSQNLSSWIDRIMELTGWNRRKVMRLSTRD